VVTRLLDSARGRWPHALVLLFPLLLAVPGPLAAQGSRWGPSLAPVDDLSPAQRVVSKRSCAEYRLLPGESRDCEPWMASADLTTGAPLRMAQADAEKPPVGEAPEPNRLLGTSRPPADDLSPSPAELVTPKPSCPSYGALSAESRACEPRMAFADLTTGTPLQLAKADADLPFVWETSESNRRLAAVLIPLTAWGLVAANSLVGYHDYSFHVHYEGWFGPNTRDGGADKASHFADYYIVSNLFSDVYRMLGYSENAARWWGIGLAVTTGLANEISDGFTRHGFSWEDLAMDTAGAGTAALISATRTQDLLGVRTSHVGGDTYTHDVYAADFKLSGLGQRLGVNLGPLRWLLLSVTYGSKGYRVTPSIQEQRQLGFEIGLNLQQILNDVGVKKDTWWGYPLHLVADNVRFPYTAFGMRVDLNRGKWHGPNNGNYD
jgi:hypothetical protein